MTELLFHATFMNKQIQSTCYAALDMLERTKNIIQNGDAELGAIHLQRAMEALADCADLSRQSTKKIDEFQRRLIREKSEIKKDYVTLYKEYTEKMGANND